MLITSWVYPWIWNWESWWWTPPPSLSSDSLSCILWFTILSSWELTITLGCLAGTSPDVQRDRNRDTWNLSNQNKDGFICNPIIVWLQKKKPWLKRKWEWTSVKRSWNVLGLAEKKFLFFFFFIHWFPKVMFVSRSAGPPHAASTHEASAFLIPRHVTWGWEPRTTMGASSRTKHSEWGDTVLLVPPHLAPHQVGVCLLGRTGTPPGGKSCTELPLTSPQKHTYSRLTVV